MHLRYGFISRQGSSFPVHAMCRVLRASAAGCSDWFQRPPGVTERRREELAVVVRQVHADVKARYGSRRMHAEVVARGDPCAVNTGPR